MKVGTKGQKTATSEDDAKKSGHVAAKMKSRLKGRVLESALDQQMGSGRLLAKITSRPGQCGRVDGVILEGPEYIFYQKMMARK